MPCTSLNTTFQKEVDKLEPFKRMTARRVKGLETDPPEKLGMLSLEKTEKRVMVISSSIFKLLDDEILKSYKFICGRTKELLSRC